MSRVPTGRFIVRRCDTERISDRETVLVFLVPQEAAYDSDDNDDPVAEIIQQSNQSAIPSDLAFPSTDTEQIGDIKEPGVWLQVPEVITPGAVIDLQLHIVGKSA